jgi:hypothetical protein
MTHSRDLLNERGSCCVKTFRSQDRLHQRRRIVLEVDAWVPAAEVLAAFRFAQLNLLGRENRPPSERNVRLFKFVVEHMYDTGRLPPGATMLEAWNAAHPDERYDNVRNFQRDFRRAERALLIGVQPAPSPNSRRTGEWACERPAADDAADADADWLEGIFAGNTVTHTTKNCRPT